MHPIPGDDRVLVERYLRAVLEPSGERAALGAIVHPELMIYGYNAAANRPRSPLRGLPAVLERYRLDAEPACPDLRVEVAAVVAERDLVAVALTCSGTHTGAPLLGAPASGNTIRYEGLVICRVNDGRIFEQWGGFDSLGLAQQLRLAPAGTWPAPGEIPARGPGPVRPALATPRELVRGYWEQTFNERSSQLCGDEEALLGVFPDCRVRVDDLFAADDLVCARLSSRGTHQGAWLGIAPTSKAFSYEATFIFRIRDGAFAERWGGFDRLLMAHQIGALHRDVSAL